MSCSDGKSCCMKPKAAAPSNDAVFNKFGKTVKDLLKKGYDFNNVVKGNYKPVRPLSVDASYNVGSNAPTVKAKYTDNTWGEAEAELASSGSSSATAQLKKLADGLNVTLGVKCDKYAGSGKAEVEYTAKQGSAQVTVESNCCFQNPRVTLAGSTSVGRGVSVGAQLALCVCGDGQACIDNNACSFGKKAFSTLGNKACAQLDVGVEYAASDYVASLYSEQNGSVLSGSYYTNVQNTQFGVLAQRKVTQDGICAFAAGLDQSDNKVTLAIARSLYPDTTLKAKAELPTGVLSTVIEQKVRSTYGVNATLGLAAQFNVRSNLSNKSAAFIPAKVGLTVNLE